MKQLLMSVDKLLRGGSTEKEDQLKGRLGIKIKTLIILGLLLGGVYGMFMGLYGATKPSESSFLQPVASAFKVPLLYILTLTVTFPSLYVFSTLAGSKLKFLETLKMLLIGIVINLTLLASFGTVTGFFTLSTDSYHFMVVLNVIIFSTGGVVGLVFMYKAIRVGIKRTDQIEKPAHLEANESIEPAENETDESASRFTRQRKPDNQRGNIIFNAWVIIYGCVGAQMGWILRPFIGAPDSSFELFRSHDGSSFFKAFLNSVAQLFG